MGLGRGGRVVGDGSFTRSCGGFKEPWVIHPCPIPGEIFDSPHVIPRRDDVTIGSPLCNNTILVPGFFRDLFHKYQNVEEDFFLFDLTKGCGLLSDEKTGTGK